jgi:hypothetical protein
MATIWLFIYRGSVISLCVSAVILMSVPIASSWKKTAVIACAIFGTMCLISMYFAKKTDHAEDIHLVKREIEHYPTGSDHHFDGDH